MPVLCSSNVRRNKNAALEICWIAIFRPFIQSDAVRPIYHFSEWHVNIFRIFSNPEVHFNITLIKVNAICDISCPNADMKWHFDRCRISKAIILKRTRLHFCCPDAGVLNAPDPSFSKYALFSKLTRCCFPIVLWLIQFCRSSIQSCRVPAQNVMPLFNLSLAPFKINFCESSKLARNKANETNKYVRNRTSWRSLASVIQLRLVPDKKSPTNFSYSLSYQRNNKIFYGVFNLQQRYYAAVPETVCVIRFYRTLCSLRPARFWSLNFCMFIATRYVAGYCRFIFCLMFAAFSIRGGGATVYCFSLHSSIHCWLFSYF